MNEACLELNDSWKTPHWGLMAVNREKRVVMCLIGKVARTTWLRVLLGLTGTEKAVTLASTDRYVLHSYAHKYLGRLDQIAGSARDYYLMGHYYKAMFVREPLEKLISAYRDKMFRDFNYVRMRKKIKRMFRPNVSNRFTTSYIRGRVYRGGMRWP